MSADYVPPTPFARITDPETGPYRGEWYTEQGWKAIDCYVCRPCAAHPYRTYCVRVGAVCYLPTDVRLVSPLPVPNGWNAPSPTPKES